MKKDKIRLPRREWVRSPVTKAKPSAKVYSRKKIGKITREEFWEKKEFRFCPLCSAELVKKVLDKKDRKACPVCGFVDYKNPVPTVSVIIEKEGKILLVQRKFNPYALDWSIPGGFIEYHETPEECAKRETKEETGLDIQIKNLFNIYLAIDDPRAHMISIVYLADIIEGALKAGDDAQDVQFFAPSEIPTNIAFSANKRALKEYFERKAH